MKKSSLFFLLTLVLATGQLSAQQRRLDFVPSRHGFHFPNCFRSNGPINTAGLCGGMVLAAFNYFRYRIPIPSHTREDIDMQVSYNLSSKTSGAEPLIDYIFQSQIATFSNVSVASFAGPDNPKYITEFNKAKARID